MKKSNTHREGTLEYDIWVHFNRLGNKLNRDEVINIIKMLKNSKDYLAELTQIELSLNLSQSKYDVDYLTIMRDGRAVATRSRISSVGGRKQTSAVNQYTLEGVFVKKHKSIADASKEVTGCHKRAVGSISHCARGLQRYSIGYIWEYADIWE